MTRWNKALRCSSISEPVKRSDNVVRCLSLSLKRTPLYPCLASITVLNVLFLNCACQLKRSFWSTLMQYLLREERDLQFFQVTHLVSLWQPYNDNKVQVNQMGHAPKHLTSHPWWEPLQPAFANELVRCRSLALSSNWISSWDKLTWLSGLCRRMLNVEAAYLCRRNSRILLNFRL